MKILCKAACMTGLGLIGMATAQAATYNGDLIIGFTTQSGNDTIYDLGLASSLADGQTWDLSSLLTGYNLNTVNWGIAGSKKVSGTGMIWTTTDGMTPGTLAANPAWSTLDLATKSIYQNFTVAGAGQSLSIDSADQNSWNQQTLNGSLPNQFITYGNPNVSGLTSDSLYSVTADGSTPTLLGNFSLDNGGTLTFNVTAVPEPSTVGLIGGGMLLLLVGRNQFRKQQS